MDFVIKFYNHLESTYVNIQGMPTLLDLKDITNIVTSSGILGIYALG